LNEGFASWVEVLGLNHSNPEFQSFDTFVSGEHKKRPAYRLLIFFYFLVVVHRALLLDSLYSTHPISVEVTDPDEINSIFDAISCKLNLSILFSDENVLFYILQMIKVHLFFE